MNLKSSTLFLWLFSILGQADAQSANSLLWEISGNGLAEPSYVYGTMHVGDKRVYKFSKSVMPSFESADAFAMEIDPGQADPGMMMELMKLDSGQKLQDIFTPEEWVRLDSFMQANFKKPAADFNSFSPIFLYSMIAQTTMKNQKGVPLDLYFFKEAKKAKKSIYGLETVEEQMTAITSMTMQEQRQMIMESISKVEGPEMMEEMIKYYTKGDLEKLQEMSDSAEFSSETEASLITDRNHIMADRMEPIIQKKSTFVAVGALHLPGDEGVLALLEKKGYQVRPLK